MSLSKRKTNSQVGGLLFHLALSKMWRMWRVERAREKLVEVEVWGCGDSWYWWLVFLL